MKKFLALVFALLAASDPVSAQTVTPLSVIFFDQNGPDISTVSGYAYKYYPDAATVGVPFASSVTCTGLAAPFTCKVSYPAFTPGTHTIAITASNAAGESPKSAPLSFTFAVVPAAPTNLRSGN